MKIEVFEQSSIKLTGEKTIYFDPYNIKEDFHDADYIFITHDHYDHYDLESIMNVRCSKTKIIVPRCLEDFGYDLVVDPGEKYQLDDIRFQTIRAYNVNKDFHPKSKNYVGYLLFIEGVSYYVMGDTDRVAEADLVKCDVCFVPIGGTYTMNVSEATIYINDLHPKLAIPIHYGLITGNKELGFEFSNHVLKDIKVELKI